MSAPEVYLFWDNSNIFISAQKVVPARDPGFDERALRIQFSHLCRLAVAGRHCDERCAFVVGSELREQNQIRQAIKKETGIEPVLLERGGITGTEQGVDQVLQTHILRAGLDNRDNPQVAVLLSGDGAGIDDGIGFHADMERLYKEGWGIEVLAWDISCKRELKEWAEEVGVYVRLEDYYDSVTFVEGGRRVKNLNLTRRPKTKPGAPRRAVEIDALQKEIEELRKELEPRRKHEKRLKNRDGSNNRKSRKKQKR